jgi:hypothetical protein
VKGWFYPASSCIADLKASHSGVPFYFSPSFLKRLEPASSFLPYLGIGLMGVMAEPGEEVRIGRGVREGRSFGAE